MPQENSEELVHVPRSHMTGSVETPLTMPMGAALWSADPVVTSVPASHVSPRSDEV